MSQNCSFHLNKVLKFQNLVPPLK